MPKLTTDWIRAAVSGRTVDDREITAQELRDMADSYSQDVYAARIWLEHLRGLLPDSAFKSLGDVVAVKAEDITSGDLAGQTALYVQLQPSPELIDMVRDGEKLHLSVEIHPTFPTTGGAYLMGVGVTDSPASIGTGIMQFSTKKHKDSLYSQPLACDLQGCADKGDADMLTSIHSMLQQLNQQPPPPETNKPSQKFVAVEAFDQLKQAHEDLKREFDTFMNQEEPQPTFPVHTGGNDSRDIWK